MSYKGYMVNWEFYKPILKKRGKFLNLGVYVCEDKKRITINRCPIQDLKYITILEINNMLCAVFH